MPDGLQCCPPPFDNLTLPFPQHFQIFIGNLPAGITPNELSTKLADKLKLQIKDTHIARGGAYGFAVFNSR